MRVRSVIEGIVLVEKTPRQKHVSCRGEVSAV